MIRPPRDWIIRTYGKAMYERALAAIRPEHAAVITGEIVSVGWYPLAAWSAFRNALRSQLKKEKSSEEAVLERRIFYEAGPQVLTKVYRFVLSRMNPISAVEKLMPVYDGVYSHGQVSVVSHTEENLVLAFADAPTAMQEEVRRMFPLAAEFMLDLAGQEVIEAIPSTETKGTKFTFQLKIRYRKQRK